MRILQNLCDKKSILCKNSLKTNRKKTHRSRKKFRPQWNYSCTAVEIYFDCGAIFDPF